MALVKYGGGVVQFKGSIGGTTFGNSVAGFTAKSNTMPVINKSQVSLNNRNLFGYISSYWRKNVSEANHLLWHTWSSNSPLINKWGDTFHISGASAFIRHNIGLIIAGLSISDTPPINYGWNGGYLVGIEYTIGHSATQLITFPSAIWGTLAVEEKVNIFQSIGYKKYAIKPYKNLYLTSIAQGAAFPISVASKFTLDNSLAFCLYYRVAGNNYGYGNIITGFCKTTT